MSKVPTRKKKMLAVQPGKNSLSVEEKSSQVHRANATQVTIHTTTLQTHPLTKEQAMAHRPSPTPHPSGRTRELVNHSPGVL